NRSSLGAILLAIDLLAEVPGLCRAGDAAAAPQRAANAARTRIASALLAPGLAPAAGHRRAVLLRLGAGPATGQIGSDDLMHQAFRKFKTEDLIGHLVRAAAANCQFHHFLLQALIDGRIMT